MLEISKEKPPIEPEKTEHSVQEHLLEASPKSEIEQSPIYMTEKPEPTPGPDKDVTEEQEPIAPPVKHVMKKPGDLKPVSTKSKSRKLPLPLPIIVLIAVVFLISVMVILSRSRRRKTSTPKIMPRSPPAQLVPERQDGVSAEFMPEALLRDVSGVTEEETYKIIEKIRKSVGKKKSIKLLSIKIPSAVNTLSLNIRIILTELMTKTAQTALF